MTIQDIMKKYDLKLDEEFEIVFNHQEGVKVRSVYKLTEIAENTIVFAYPHNGKIQFDPMIKILNGCEFDIKKFLWKPKENEDYCSIRYVEDFSTACVVWRKFNSSPYNIEGLYDVIMGNCYKTIKEAEKYQEYWTNVFLNLPKFKEVKN